MGVGVITTRACSWIPFRPAGFIYTDVHRNSVNDVVYISACKLNSLSTGLDNSLGRWDTMSARNFWTWKKMLRAVLVCVIGVWFQVGQKEYSTDSTQTLICWKRHCPWLCPCTAVGTLISTRKHKVKTDMRDLSPFTTEFVLSFMLLSAFWKVQAGHNAAALRFVAICKSQSKQVRCKFGRTMQNHTANCLQSTCRSPWPGQPADLAVRRKTNATFNATHI